MHTVWNDMRASDFKVDYLFKKANFHTAVVTHSRQQGAECVKADERKLLVYFRPSSGLQIEDPFTVFSVANTEAPFTLFHPTLVLFVT